MKKTLVGMLFAGLLLPAAGAGQGTNNVSKTGTAAATFLEIPVGAPAVAMGGAFVSLTNDATSLYWNVAGIALMTQNQVIASHTNWIAETRFDYAALVLPLGGFGTLGFSITSLSMDDMKVRTVEKPEGTGEFFGANDIAVSVSYARQLNERFQIGFSAKYIQQTIWHENANAFAVDIGTLFRTDLIGGLTIGASLSNFGTSMKLAGRDTREFGRINPTILGSNEQVPSNLELESWDLPLLFQIGMSTCPIKSDEYRWTIAVDALHPSDNYESLNVGTELAFRDILFLRGGYQSLFLQAHEGGLTLGMGLSSSMFFSQDTRVMFDYAYCDMGRLEAVHVFSLGVRF